MRAALGTATVVVAGALGGYPLALAGWQPALAAMGAAGAACALGAVVWLRPRGAEALVGLGVALLVLEYAAALVSATEGFDFLSAVVGIGLLALVELIDLSRTSLQEATVDPKALGRRAAGAGAGAAAGGVAALGVAVIALVPVGSVRSVVLATGAGGAVIALGALVWQARRTLDVSSRGPR